MLALVQAKNNGKTKKILGKVLRNPFTNSGTSLVEYCIISVSNSEVINNFTFEREFYICKSIGQKVIRVFHIRISHPSNAAFDIYYAMCNKHNCFRDFSLIQN